MACVAFAVPKCKRLRDKAAWAAQLDAFRAAVAQEYYQSDAVVDMPGDEGEIRIDRANAGPLSILRYVSSAHTQVDRSWKQIRADGSRFLVIWFVLKGSLWITQKDRTARIEPGTFALSSSGVPFRISSTPDTTGCHESCQILVPRHVVAGLPRNVEASCARPFLMTAPATLSLAMFETLLETAEEIGPDLAERTALTALEALISAMPAPAAAGDLDRAAQDRLKAVGHYIERNIDVQGLTAETVARACGISTSYMFKLLAAQGGNFRGFLWTFRLERARQILEGPGARAASIGEIARMVGFRSNAHFSRAFRKQFGMRPTDCARSR